MSRRWGSPGRRLTNGRASTPKRPILKIPRPAVTSIAENPDRLFAAASACLAAGSLSQAERLFQEILCVHPAHAESLHRLGVLAHQTGHPRAAATLIGRAIAVDGQRATYHCHLGIVLHAQGDLDAAADCYERAIALEPSFAEAWTNLGNARLEQGETGAAVEHHRKALDLKPAIADFHYNLGNALRVTGGTNAAIEAYRNAILRSPGHADAHLNLALLLLLKGDFAEGLEQYEWRWRVRAPTSPERDFDQPPWRGEVLGSRVLLIHAEQGLGDTIQFCRYVAMVAKRGQVVFEVPRPLVRLISSLDPGCPIIAKGDQLPPFDVHCPLLSLPWAMGTRRDSIPGPVPYLFPAADQVARWRDRIATEGLRIGITWQGNANARLDRDRSVPLAQFAPLAQIPGVRLFSLQKADGVAQLARLPNGFHVETFGGTLDAGADAFMDTAALMASLDLVITPCTAVAHLAGALGRPVWIALQALPHWTWMLETDTSPWYPTARLFRQSQAGDWTGVFDRMAKALGELAA